MVESLIKMSKEGDFLGKCTDKRNNAYMLNTSDDSFSNNDEDFDDTSSTDSFSDN
jgi:hypothetical protein